MVTNRCRGESAEWLRILPFLRELDQSALADIAGLGRRRRYAPGQIIVLQGDSCRSVGFIIEGWVRVSTVSLEGREQVMMRLGPGEAFCLVAALEDGPNPATVEAFTDVTAYVLRKEDFLHIVRQYPGVALAILENLAAKVRHLIALVEDLSLRTVEQRLARLLLRLAKEKAPVHRRMTRKEMAAELGTVREVVARTLRRLEEEKTIRFDRHRIVILDAAALETKASV
jgi:CRP-like cAMP-binding protein